MEIVCGPCLKVLIAYYSYTGNTRTIAQAVRQKTCGVLFGVETEGSYPHCNKLLTKDEHKAGNVHLPALKYTCPTMACYDVILVGGPVWSGRLPPPLRAFLSRTDFAGKPVAAFCTYERDSQGFLADFSSMARNAQLCEGLGLNICHNEYGPVMSGLLDRWLHQLGILDSACGWPCRW